MAIYIYRAKTANGKETKGKIEADNEVHFKKLMREKRLYPLDYKKETAMNKEIDFSFLQKVTLKDLTIFTRQFAAMIMAGLTVITSLEIMKTQIQNKKLRDSTEHITDEVQKGAALSETMRQYPAIYPDILVNMVAAGEQSGKLDVSLERASDHFEKESQILSKIKGAMTYPVVVCVVALIAIAFIIAVVVPGFVSVFEQIGSDLPGTTKLLISMSDVFRNYWYLLILGAFGIFMGYRAYVATPAGRERVDFIKLKIPVFGPINQKVAVSRFCRTLATMMEAGLPLLQAIDITGSVLDNAYMQRKLAIVHDEVSRGSGLAGPLEASNLFPPMVTHMVSVGESTGDTESLLYKTATFYDDEVELAVKQLTTALEPFILVVLGGAIAFIVLAILQPMFALYQGVENL